MNQNYVTKVPIDIQAEKIDKEKSDQKQHKLFKEPEPWDEPVNGEVLLDDIVTTLNRYLVLPDKAAEAIVLWILFTYGFDLMRICPILLLTSPEKRCGKTSVMSLLMKLCYRAMPASNITPAALFRTTEKYQPTLCIDEADTYMKDNKELIGIINSGHTKDLAYVQRLVGDNYEPKTFSTWAPKVIASIGKLKDTLIDRSIIIPMRRKSQHEQVQRLKDFNGTEIKRRCLRFVKDNEERLRNYDPDIPVTLNDRAADNWEPLFTIADIAGGKWPKLARDAAIVLTQMDEDDDSIKVQLLADIQRIFSNTSTNKIHTDYLLRSLNDMDERPWSEWRHGKEMNPRNLAQLLKPFGISSKTVRIDDIVKKGYELGDFTEAFTRYLSKESVTTLQTSTGVPFSDSAKVTDNRTVTDENALKRASDNDCNLVTDKSGEKRMEWII